MTEIRLFTIAAVAIGALAAEAPALAQRGAEPGEQQSENSSAQQQQGQPQSQQKQQQNPQKQKHQQKPEAAQVGAGTTNGTTTGTSHPMHNGGQEGKPPLPQASLCDSYDGDAHTHCLETVLREKRVSSRSANQQSSQ